MKKKKKTKTKTKKKTKITKVKTRKWMSNCLSLFGYASNIET